MLTLHFKRQMCRAVDADITLTGVSRHSHQTQFGRIPFLSSEKKSAVLLNGRNTSKWKIDIWSYAQTTKRTEKNLRLHIVLIAFTLSHFIVWVIVYIRSHVCERGLRIKPTNIQLKLFLVLPRNGLIKNLFGRWKSIFLSSNGCPNSLAVNVTYLKWKKRKRRKSVLVSEKTMQRERKQHKKKIRKAENEQKKSFIIHSCDPNNLSFFFFICHLKPKQSKCEKWHRRCIIQQPLSDSHRSS